MQTANTIDEVIQQLDQIITDSISRKSRLGYFACLYRKMTIAVKEGIQKGAFQDGPRMERLDVIFASRYLSAYNCLQQNTPPTNSWKYAFDAAKQSYTVIQHLLLGMNAHINLDLVLRPPKRVKAQISICCKQILTGSIPSSVA